MAAASRSAENASPNYAWYVVGVLTLANVCALVDRQILSLLVIPLRQDLGLTLTQTSYLQGVPFAVFFTLMGLPIARLADRGNRRTIITVGIALWSVMTAACGLASTYSRLLLARIGVGVGEASLQAPGTSLMADYFDRDRLSTAMSVFQTGIFLGSGVAYLIGGWAVGFVAGQPPLNLPIIGEIRQWQTVFMIVGLPGILVALLMLTVREPARREVRTPMPIKAVLSHFWSNARTFGPLVSGLTLSASVNWGIAFFLATFLQESHGWSPARAGSVQGLLTIFLGPVGVLGGGFLDRQMRKRGMTDAPLRVAMIAAAGMLVSASAYPFAQSGTAVIGWLAVVNVFAAMPWGAAAAAAAELVPSAMRAQGVAVYFLGVNLVSQLLGPWAVAAITDRVFQNDAALGSSLAIVNVAGMLGAIVLLAIAMPAYRSAVAVLKG
jgi:MFS family permease